jgi:hypothetical protein
VGEDALIPAVRNGCRPWAILGRRPLGAEVGKHSVNPRLVADARNLVVLGREPAVQGANRPVPPGITGLVDRL